METKEPNLVQEGSRKRPSAAAIRFADGDGKVLSWAPASHQTNMDLKFRSDLNDRRRWAKRRAERVSGVASESGGGVQGKKPARTTWFDLTVFTGYIDFFLLLAAATLVGVAAALH